MPHHRRSGFLHTPSLAFVLLCGLFFVLLIAGGASRADAAGQILVRSVAWAMLLVAIIMGPRPEIRRMGMAGLVLVAALLLVLVQLVPLPPSIWQAMPGRMVFEDADIWRSLSMAPGATWNSLSSLIVPGVVLLLAVMMRDDEQEQMLAVLLCVTGGAALVGLLQFSGAGFTSPFVNDTPGQVSGLFANRNHFALFLALGCLIAPVWAIRGGVAGWRLSAALGMVLLLILTILATGSRAGMLVGMIATGIALLMSRHALRRLARRGPDWLFPALIIGAILILAAFVALFVAADRAVSISRAVSVDGSEDMRVRGLPTVLDMIHRYFPVGSGFGGFDPIFRLHEPFGLLKLTYFNHAHNDYLEIALDGGVPALILLALAVMWWGARTIRVWRREDAGTLSQLGSAIIFLVLIASFFDYPVRTPIIMGLTALAGLWLGERREEAGAALPHQGQQL